MANKTRQNCGLSSKDFGREHDQKLMLIPVSKNVGPLIPAAMHEHAAAKYVGMNRTSFRDLVFDGIIPFTKHLNGKTRIYLKTDLDRYLESLPKSKMVERENSPVAALEGAAK